MRSKKSFIKKYGQALRLMHIKIPVLVYFAGSFAVAVLALLFLLAVFPVFLSITPSGLSNVLSSLVILFPVLVFIIILDFLLGYPYWRYLKRTTAIEANLSDALKQMADVLKAGGTYEFALREVATSDFGPLTDEMEKVLRSLEEGENFENSMKLLQKNIDSRLVSRTVTIIIDSVRAGAGLADILEDIAEDVRETFRVDAERRTRTLMQSMFMFAAGAVVAPLIFGVVSALIVFLIESSTSIGIASLQQLEQALFARDRITFLLQAYIFIEILATSVMISLMREGRPGKSIIYLPILLFIAFFVFFIARIMATVLLSGGI